MARIVKDYDERYTEFLDAAQALFFSKGYEQTSVQDIIRAVGVAKGTFYHYFDSKVDILDAVVKRTRERVLKSVQPIIEDQSMDAATKLRRFFHEINNWKLDNHSMILQMLRLLHQDENALLRLKMFEETRNTLAAPLTKIIEQGIAESMFEVVYARETAEIILRIIESFSPTLVHALLNGHYDPQDMDKMKREFFVFNQSIERLLGVPKNRIDLISDEALADWLVFVEKIAIQKAV